MANISAHRSFVSNPANGGSGSVLVVDDDASICRVIRDALESEGFSVATSSDGIEALGMAERIHPQLVILDVHLPRLRGERVAEELAARSAGRIRILTITSDEHIAESARQMRAVAYLRKPFDVGELIRIVQNLLPVGCPN